MPRLQDLPSILPLLPPPLQSVPPLAEPSGALPSVSVARSMHAELLGHLGEGDADVELVRASDVVWGVVSSTVACAGVLAVAEMTGTRDASAFATFAASVCAFVASAAYAQWRRG